MQPAYSKLSISNAQTLLFIKVYTILLRIFCPRCAFCRSYIKEGGNTLTMGKSVSNMAANLKCNIKISPMIRYTISLKLDFSLKISKKIFWVIFFCMQLNALFQFF